MERNIVEQIKRRLSTNKWKRAGRWLLCGAGGLVAGCMVWALLLPAITMANDPICGLEAHTHNEECLEVVNYLTSRIITCDPNSDSAADVILHQHDGMCYEGDILICDLQEVPPHMHSAACYVDDADGFEQNAFHVHSQDCYEERRGALLCGQTEREEHHHTEDCYSGEQSVSTVLTCNRTEDGPGIPHQHDEGCYGLEFIPVTVCGKEETLGHMHTDNCFQMDTVLICGFGGEDTSGTTTTKDSTGGFDLEEKEPLCGLEEHVVHTHTDACYESRTVNGRVSNVLVCGLSSVIIHQHSYRCSEKVEPGEHEVIVCGFAEHVHSDTCYMKLDPDPDPYHCGFTEHEHGDNCFTEVGELKCSVPEHTHTEECLGLESAPDMEYPMGHSEYLCGKEEHTHTENCYEGDVLECLREEHTHCAECLTSDKFSEPEVKDCGLVEHQHTEACRNEIGEYVCGYTQHVHDESCCPSWNSSEDGLAYLCGLAEHAHDEVCSDLGCELTEHMHTEECLYSGGVDANGLPLSMELDGLEYIVETEDFTVVFRISGTATFDPEISVPAEAAQDAVAEDASADADTLTVIADEAPPLSDLPITDEDTLTPVLQIDATDDSNVAEGLKANASGTLTEDELDELDIYQIVITDDYGRVADLSLCTMDVEFIPKNPETVKASPELEADDPEAQLTSAVAVYTDTDEVWATLNEDTGTYQVSDVSLYGGNAGLYATTSISDPTFTVQYYAEIDTIALGGGTLPVIDTSGGKLPQNGGSTSSVKNATLNTLALENGKVKTQNGMHKMFLDHAFHYLSAPGLKYVNIVTNLPEPNYRLKEIWIPKRAGNGKIITDLSSTNPAHWRVFTWTGSDAPKFTNRPKTVLEHPDRYILIEPDSVVRLIYTTTSSEKTYDANFYDYDISNGCIYRTALPTDATVSEYRNMTAGESFKDGSLTPELFTWAKGYSKWKGASAHFWTYTVKQGINLPANYKGSGTKFAFGHENTGTGLGSITWSKDGYANVLNGYNKKGYQGCTFGMATGVKNGQIQFSSTLDVPSLFSEKIAQGKSIYDKGQYSLEFARSGDTYVLTGVSGTNIKNLDTFTNPGNSHGIYDGKHYSESTGKLLSAIWTNNFWPMDSAPSFSTGTHDIAFGGVETAKDTAHELRFTNNANSALPESDDGQYHNSYFGMNFAITFDVSHSYMGPLEYAFFGDDDMWVFLTELAADGETAVGDSKLVVDIGGVHSSVGEYVNLWDYIKKPSDTVINSNAFGDFEEDSITKYRLDFFYTERGASGSTCWMQFTLPTVVSAKLEQNDEEHGSMRIRKVVDGTESPQEFQFRLDFSGVSTYKEGQYYRILDTGEVETVKFDATKPVLFDLHHDEDIIINNIPDGVKYTLTELDDSRYGYYTTYKVTEDREGEQVVSSEEISSSVSGVIHGGVSTGVVFTNHSSYSMPHTGAGTKTIIPAFFGGTLACMSCLAWWYKRRNPANRLRG